MAVIQKLAKPLSIALGLMMNKKQYCQKLLEHRDGHMPLHLFLGGKWIFLKVVLIAMGSLLLVSPSVGTKLLGALAIGYALGKIVAGLMSYRVSKTTWRFTCDLLHWDRVSEIAAEQEGKSQPEVGQVSSEGAPSAPPDEPST